MPFDLDAVRRRLSAMFSGFTSGQKVMTALAAVGLVAGGFYFMSWAGRPSYEPLFSNLDPAAASDVTQRLSSQGVPYQLANGGNTIMVPKDKVQQARLDLAADGLPASGSPGYDILEDQGLTTSQRMQDINIQRALEGELRKTIESIEGVSAANVHLVIPQEDLFATDEARPTASVLVKSGPGASLNGRQVQSIVNLVSSSVEGLKPEDVTVADSKGNTYAAPGMDSQVGAGDLRRQATMEFEQDVAAAVKSLLSEVVGQDGMAVTVNATLDFDQQKTTRERVSASDPPATVSERSVTEQFEGTNSSVGGTLGPVGAPTGSNGDQQYERQEEERTNATNRVVDEIERAPGAVERMSVAVLVDSSKAGGIDVDAVEEVVVAAAGLDEERGDLVEVQEVAFDTTAEEEAEEALKEAEAEESRRQLMSLVRTVGSLAVVFVVLFLAYRSAKRAGRERRLPIPVESLALPPGAGGGDGGVYVDPDVTQEITLPGPRQAQQALEQLQVPEMAVGAEVADLIDRQPEEVAQLLRGWLADRRDR